ncbi:MAG: class I SAM-dependent methyltransferase, partial [Acidimicrobiales bacterium]
DAAPSAPVADVVVCHHVVYNVAELVPFLIALSGHARRRVVVELTEKHPLSSLSPLWLSIHRLERPSSPTSSGAVAIAEALGYGVHVDRFEESSTSAKAPIDERVAFARRKLCAGPEHDEEIASYLSATADQPEELVTFYWDV